MSQQSTYARLLGDLVRKDQRRKSRRQKLGKIASGLLESVLLTAVYGWWLMLAIGVIHHEWIAQCPTIGYGWATLLVVLVRSALHPKATKSGEAK